MAMEPAVRVTHCRWWLGSERRLQLGGLHDPREPLHVGGLCEVRKRGELLPDGGGGGEFEETLSIREFFFGCGEGGHASPEVHADPMDGLALRIDRTLLEAASAIERLLGLGVFENGLVEREAERFELRKAAR